MRRTESSLSGIAAAVLTVAGIFMLISVEADTKTDDELLSHYADSGNRAGEIVGFVLVAIGAGFFLWFVSALRSRLRSAEPEPRTLSTLGFGAGVAAAGLTVSAAAILVGVSFTAEISDHFEVDPDAARLAVSTGYVFLLGSSLVNCVLVATTSVLILRSEILPRWMGWVGFAFIVLAIVEMFLLPVLVIPAWIVVVSLVSMTRSSARNGGSGQESETPAPNEPVAAS